MKTVLQASDVEIALAAPVFAGTDGDQPAPLPGAERVRCFHCGEICKELDFTKPGKNFCCHGCLIVHELLEESGLGHFYDLSTAPGVRIRRQAHRNQYTYLDDPAVAEQLLDFTDGKTSRITLHIPAIHCIACVWLLENLFKLHTGIGQSRVNFSRREVCITFAPARIKLSELVALLVSIGYEPELTLGEIEKAAPSMYRKRAWLQIGLAAFAFGNIMLMSLPFYLGLDSVNGPWFREVAGWLSLAMALPVVTFSAWDFWRAAWFSVRQRVLTLEVPITLGLAAIYSQSIFEVATHRGPGYCDSLCGVIFFLLCGRLFQRKTFDRLTFDRDYKGFFPLAVTRKTATGEEPVALTQLQSGDHLVLRNGELLPADAKLVSGDACMDYSFVTGESEPVAHRAGDHLYAGGRQCGGAIEVETIKPVAESYLATLWDNEAFRKKRDNDLDTITNRYSRRFTLLIVSIAAGAALFWAFKDPAISLKAFTAVLIVACPCALALAAPLTHGTAQRLLERRKIYLKNSQVMETLAVVDTIVLDKTGTLTKPEAGAVKFHSVDPLTVAEKKWIASVAGHSTHPLSTQVVKDLGAAALPVADFVETPGFGIEGGVLGHRIQLGSRAWFESQPGISGIPSDESVSPASVVCVAMDGIYRGAFAVEGSLRAEVETLISQLHGRYKLVLLSGDNEREAARFEKMFGGKASLRFNQSPADKLDFIRRLQEKGHRVMMVGDGLNDAGALKQADVGVAVVERIGVFSPASDLIVDAGELPQLARVLKFSRNAVRVVRTGFGISSLYNLLGVSIAATGWLAPIVCAILMPLSTLTIVVFSCAAATWVARQNGLLTATTSTGGQA